MVRDNFIFFKNIKYKGMNTFFNDFLENNFIFFKKSKDNIFINDFLYVSNKSFNVKKINTNNKCINILYF